MRFNKWFKKSGQKRTQKLSTDSETREYIHDLLKKDNPEKLYEDAILDAFKHCDDVFRTTITFNIGSRMISVLLLYCEGLCNQEQLNEKIIPELERIFVDLNEETLTKLTVESQWRKYPLTTAKDIPQVISDVFDGKLLIYIKDWNIGYIVDIAEHPQRNPDEPHTEISVRGARDGFIEEIRVNTALIRKRLRTNSLCYEEFTIGTRTKTRVGLFYIEDIASPDVVKELRSQLKSIDIDGLVDSNQLEELLTPNLFRMFPIFHYTGRPDFAAEALLNGRSVLLINGSPTVLLAPVSLTFLLKAGEDNATYFFYNSAQRIIRLFSLIMATSLPGFWVALTSFHHNQIPFILLAGLAQVRQGVPLPIPLEAFTMIIIFELFREAGLRLPAQVGQTLSVVGGIIIGDAAIRAGLTSPSMVVIVATSAVATFALVNQSLGGTISILRIYILALSSFLGLFGFLIASFSILLYVANLRSYGIPYLSPLAPLNWRDIINGVTRPSWRQRNKRAAYTEESDYDR